MEVKKRAAEAARKAATPAPDGFRFTLFSGVQTLVFALLLLIVAFTFFGRIITVNGISMEPSLWEGEVLLLQRVGYTPKQGDIVVLTKPFGSVTHPYVKRVIATGGQTVSIDYLAGEVRVDGVAIHEPYIKEPMLELSYPRDSIYIEVPEGHVFVMGDNRNNSDDSRNIDLGAVDERYILGKAFFVLLPPRGFGLIPGA